jgi:hypothetical protein
LINNSGGYAIGTTSFTVDGTSLSSVFSTDNQPVYTSSGNKLGHIHLAGTLGTTVTIKSRSVHPVLDNEELYLLPDTLPESRNDYLKIGVVQTKYFRLNILRQGEDDSARTK